jgi:Zn-dependent M28 family amino/carboxypeptidase
MKNLANHKTITTTIFLLFITACVPRSTNLHFDGQRALSLIEDQVAFGPRIPGAPGHAQAVTWMQENLHAAGWSTEIQEATMMGHPIKNIIARREGEDGAPWIILGAHYDTRIYADRDPDPQQRDQPVPGANDGASGVAVLLELARVLPEAYPGTVWLVFFDAEDNGDIQGWDWILGSRAFVDSLEGQPDAVVIVDMIGDADLNIKMEPSSDANLTAEIWSHAAKLGYEEYVQPVLGPRILDDHTPFLRAGIPAVDIIDFDYRYWHTTEDTLDKVSAESLQVVGDTLIAWLKSQVDG